MKVAAVATVRNEADIIERSVLHLLAEGVDTVYIADGLSTDGTRELLEGLMVEGAGVELFTDGSPYHYQPKWIGLLAAIAANDGADWIIPFDADEFVYATRGVTIREALEALTPTVRKLHMRTFQHRDWEHREVNDRSMGKVAFRYEEGVRVANGNHDAWLPSGAATYVEVLDLREWQFRSYEHLVRKCRERVATIDPSLPHTDGLHQRVLAAMSDTDLKAEWERKQALPVVYDPIPTRAQHAVSGR